MEYFKYYMWLECFAFNIIDQKPQNKTNFNVGVIYVWIFTIQTLYILFLVEIK